MNAKTIFQETLIEFDFLVAHRPAQTQRNDKFF